LRCPAALTMPLSLRERESPRERRRKVVTGTFLALSAFSQGYL
jgi:hypothetical protein